MACASRSSQLQAGCAPDRSFSYHFWMKDMIPLRYHNGNQYLHRKSPDYRNLSNAKCAPTMPSSRLAWSSRDCSIISPPPHPSLFGVPSGLGCAPFVPTSRHRSLSWQKRCAKHFPNFSWVLQKAIPSRNSSSSHRPLGFVKKQRLLRSSLRMSIRSKPDASSKALVAR
jgi:hypothetical protein